MAVVVKVTIFNRKMMSQRELAAKWQLRTPRANKENQRPPADSSKRALTNQKKGPQEHRMQGQRSKE